VKKVTIALLLTLGAVSLLGCRNQLQSKEEPLQPMQQSYQGVIPCADCEGIKVSLFLDQDGTFVLKQAYQGGKAKDSTFAEYGKWERTADQLVLTNTTGEKRYFKPLDNGLKMLDTQGQAIESSFNYQLASTELSLPTTPMALKGLFQHKDGNATFADCATGKILLVEKNITLNQGYRQYAKQQEQPVLLSLNGHYKVEAAQGKGIATKVLVPDNDIQFVSGRGCND